MKNTTVQSKLSKPVRSYIYETPNNILTNIRVKAFINKEDQYDYVEELASTGNVITIEEVKTIFHKQNFELTEEEATFYTYQLNILRVTDGIDNLPKNKNSELIIDSLYTLSKTLIHEIEAAKNFIERNKNNPLSEEYLQTCEIIMSYVNIQKEVLNINDVYPLEWLKLKVHYWHHDAIYLMFIIVDFANRRSTKPSIKHEKSSVICLIKTSLALTEIANVTTEAIIKAIKRFPKEHALENFIKENTK